MMKRFIDESMLLITLLAMSVWSCKPEEEPKAESKVNLQNDELVFPWEGGSDEVVYSIENPQEGVAMTFDNVPAWVSLNLDTEGIISVTAEENKVEEERVAEIKGKYAEAEFSFTVRQSAFNQLPSKVELETDKVMASKDGGEYEVAYTIENPREDCSIEFENVPEWITVNLETQGKIILTISANDVEDIRQAVLDGKYADQKFTLAVEQEAAGPKPLFDIELVETGINYVTINVKPRDLSMEYLVVAERNEIYEACEDDNQFLSTYLVLLENNVKAKFGSLKYYFSKMDLVKTGELSNYQVQHLTAGRKYRIGCVGYNKNNFTFETEYISFTADTKAVDLLEPDMEVTSTITGPLVDLDIKPADNTMFFTAGLTEADSAPSSEAIINSYQRTFYVLMEYYMAYGGFSAEEAIDGLTYNGDKTLSWVLKEEKSYCAFVMGFDKNEGYINTVPVTELFKTAPVSPSDNVFDVTIKNIQPKQIDVRVLTTNNDPYVLGAFPVSRFEGMNDEEIMAELYSGKFSFPSFWRGNLDYTYKLLTPDTDYYLFVWGHLAGKPTTDLTKLTFRTAAQSSGTNVYPQEAGQNRAATRDFFWYPQSSDNGNIIYPQVSCIKDPVVTEK